MPEPGPFASFDGASAPILADPHDPAIGPGGRLRVADKLAARIAVFDPETLELVAVIGARGRRPLRLSVDFVPLQILDHPRFGFIGPRYLDVDPWGRLVVADQDADRILLIDPEGFVVDGSRYYISDSDNNRVVRYSVVTN